ncbi:RNA polymerase [Lophiostoma macrostomum CBS 122681]|uniref:DNA-directed RNA polymerases I, II, and III subunit RPABC3 n=1 Tax=Lophiostoma macrostomum CBS 122681 TaxID=1314788 RepID=A0A6A6SV44_9PLEO|nr:RNA polymerase [Lophiostoma macrostomum CBS 122681]
MSADAQKFEDTFTITSVNAEKYDRVSRIFGQSTSNDVTLSLDINHELFPVSVGDAVNLVLADSINLQQDGAGGAKETTEKGWREAARGEPTLADMFEYVCHGRIYKFENPEGESGNVKCYISFGGLLLCLEGPYRRLSGCAIGKMYMLCKK